MGLGVACLAGHSQVSVNFANAWSGYLAPDYLSDGKTKLGGPEFQAELMVGPSADNLAPIATASFDSGLLSGLFFGGSASIYTVNCWGTAYMQLNVWNTNAGATFDAARASGLADAWGQSSIFTVIVYGGSVCCEPPCVPNNLLGIPSVALNPLDVSPPPQPTTPTYSTNNGAIAVTGYIGVGGAVTIPSAVNGIAITSVADGAFAGSTLTGITIPNTVTNIGPRAFYDCYFMAEVSIPNSVTEIGDQAFQNCFNLTNVLIPDSVATIGDEVFYNCYSLFNVVIGSGVTTIGDSAFALSGLTTITIPDNVVNVGTLAFQSCRSLTNVVIGKNYINIKAGTFSICASLTRLTIPDTVRNIGDGAFASCWYLGDITLGNGVTNIGNGAFSSCLYVPTLIIPASVQSIGIGAFDGCRSLGTIYFLGNTPNTDANALGLASHTVYYVPGTTGWGTTFAGAPTVPWDPEVPCLFSITNGTLTVAQYIGSGGVVSIPAVINGVPVTGIGDAAFSNASPTSVIISNGVTTIGNQAFMSCYSLTNVTLPSSVVTIGYWAFSSCSNLTRVTLPDSIIAIGEYAFYHCSALTNVTLPNQLTYLPQQIFDGCSNLVSVTIPGAVTNLGTAAFFFCNGLKSVYFRGNAPTMGWSPFYGVSPAVATIYYLAGTTGWGTNFAGLPTALWNPATQAIGVRNNQFGFQITGTTNIPIAVQTSTNLAIASWVTLQSYTLTNGSVDFTDPDWTNYPSRFYRVRWPEN
jgi:hypothetical protein